MYSLSDTAKMMTSSNYRERFQAEYIQTKIRYERLKSRLNKYAARTMECKPVENYDRLTIQQRAMGDYLHCLEIRAEAEGIPIPATGLLKPTSAYAGDCKEE